MAKNIFQFDSVSHFCMRFMTLLSVVGLSARGDDNGVEVSHGAGVYVTFSRKLSVQQRELIASDLHPLMMTEGNSPTLCGVDWSAGALNNDHFVSKHQKYISQNMDRLKVTLPSELKAIVEWRRRWLQLSSDLCTFEMDSWISFLDEFRAPPSAAKILKVIGKAACEKERQKTLAPSLAKCRGCENMKVSESDPLMKSAEKDFDAFSECVQRAMRSKFPYPQSKWDVFRAKYIKSEKEYTP